MAPLDISFLTLGALYAVVLVWLIAGLWKTRWATRAFRNLASSESGDRPPSVSIVVAARNEEGDIEGCLKALLAQRYGGSLEVIIVDDRSSDGTAAIVERVASTNARLKLVRAAPTPRYRCPKKSALAQGIEKSIGELLLLTDADCTPPPCWAEVTAARFTESEVGVVMGYARPRPAPGLRQRLLALDNVAIGALAAGSAGGGMPLACSGRNLAYRRTVYDDVGGFASIGHLIGGDDVYFARKVAARGLWKMIFNWRPEAIVENAPDPVDLSALMNQKLRHASKAGRYGGSARLLGIGAYLFFMLSLLAVCQIAVAMLVWMGLGDGNTHFSFGNLIELPVGPVQNGLTDGFLEVHPFMVLAKDFPDRNQSQVFIELGFNWADQVRSAPQGSDPAFESILWNVGGFYPIGAWRTTLEINGSTNKWDGGKRNEIYITPGIINKLSREWEIGLASPIGATRVSDDYRIVGYLMWEFELE